MRDVEDLDQRRYERLVRELLAEMDTHGEATALVDELSESVDVWQAAAKDAAGRLGKPVRTGLHPDGTLIWAALVIPRNSGL